VSAVTRDAAIAAMLLFVWACCSGFVWRIAARPYVLSISDFTARSGLAIASLVLSGGIAYLLVNAMYRAFGGSGSFARWAFNVLDALIKRRP
jgi:hypothetical protein